jgi:hypothetical protein
MDKKKKIIIIVAVILVIVVILLLIHKYKEYKWNNIDVSNSIHGVIIEDEVNFYRKPKESRFRIINTEKIGTLAYIVEEYIDKNNTEWYKVKIDDKVGYVLKNKIKYYTYNDKNENVLMSDVSKFNVIYEHFENSGEYAAFILNYNINYSYIRLGGRGYGNEGNFYTDPQYQLFIDACDYLGVPYGFYYVDEAITSEEIDEEVEFVKEFIDKNATKNYVLPVVIDAEYHDGVGRADEMWEDERADLIEELVEKFQKNNIETIVYSNANTANKYLSNINAKFWVAYYDKKNKIPDNWYTDTDQEAAQNEEFTNKIVAWQFTETGIDKNYPVDLNIVKNTFFKKFVNVSSLEEK